MESAPIHRGANSPQGRPRHAVVLVLVRVIAITGFAVAGWLAMAALTDSASAAQPGPRVAVPGDGTVREAAPALQGLAPAQAGVRPVLGAVPARVRENGDRRLRALGAWQREISGVPDRLRDIEHDPVRFLQERRHEVFDGKDQAVQQVRGLADAAGVPRVEIAGVRPTAPLGGELVQGITDVRPGLPDDEPQTGETPETPADDEARASGEEPPAGAEAAPPPGRPSPAPPRRTTHRVTAPDARKTGTRPTRPCPQARTTRVVRAPAGTPSRRSPTCSRTGTPRHRPPSSRAPSTARR